MSKRIEEVADVAEILSNLISALSMPIPDRMHVDCLRSALPPLCEKLKAFYVAETGEDPWATHQD